jgi:hypothetical protein
LYAQLAYRGFYTEDWQAAIDILETHGWIRQGKVSEAGQVVRKDVEAKTDAYFFASWDALGASELEEMLALMQKIDARCQELAQ